MTNALNKDDGQQDDALVLRYVVKAGQCVKPPLEGGEQNDLQDNSQEDTVSHSMLDAAPPPLSSYCTGAFNEHDASPDDDAERAYHLTMSSCACIESPLEKSKLVFADKFQAECLPGNSQDVDKEIPFITIHVPDPKPFEPAVSPPIWKRVFGKKKKEAKKKRTGGPGSASGKPELGKRKKIFLPRGRALVLMLAVAVMAFFVFGSPKSCQRSGPSNTTGQPSVPSHFDNLRYAPDDMDNIWKARTGSASDAPEKKSDADGS